MLPELQLNDTAPWKQRFRAPAIFATEIAGLAPDRGLAVSNRSGVYQLYAWDVPGGELTQLTDQPEGKMLGTLGPDGRYVYYLDDEQGNEIGHFVGRAFEGGPSLGRAFEGGAKEDITPDLPAYSPTGFAISGSGNLMGLTAGVADGFHLYVMDVAPGALGTPGALGAPGELFHSKALVRGPVLSHDGQIAVMASTARSGKFQFSLLAFDTSSGEQIAELWDGPDTSLEPAGFAPLPGDTRLLATTNRTGLETLLLWDPRSGERVDLEIVRQEGALAGQEGALTAHGWSPDGKRILFSAFHQAIQQVCIYGLESGALVKLDHASGSGFMPPYFEPGGDVHVHWETSTRPCQVLAFDGQTGSKKGGALAAGVLGAGGVPRGHPWRTVAFPATDGQEIQGWLALPEGDGPFPTILETHGGPTGVQGEEFSPSSQAWLDHGFAYLTINYRGSTTFGREFQEKILGDLGHWEVEDMVAARDWLVGEGIALPDKILLTGWSYGGYLTLQALGRYPDLWAGGIAGTAIADWVVQYDDSAEALRGYQVSLFGGTPEEKPKAYAAASPITYVEAVQAPVLIIQGRNDTRTPARPIEMYEAQMRSLGKAVQVHWFESGHLGPYAQAEQAIEHQEMALRFAYRVVNG